MHGHLCHRSLSGMQWKSTVPPIVHQYHTMKLFQLQPFMWRVKEPTVQSSILLLQGTRHVHIDH